MAIENPKQRIDGVFVPVFPLGHSFLGTIVTAVNCASQCNVAALPRHTSCYIVREIRMRHILR